MKQTNEYFPESCTHPGSTLAEKLEELDMGSKEFAVRTGKPEQTITAVLKGQSSITPDMAVLFEAVLQIPASFWLNSQRSYDEYLARVKRQVNLEQASDWARRFPYQALSSLGYLPKATSYTEMSSNLMTFFGLASPAAWENYYCNAALKSQFRVALTADNHPEALSTWLRIGEIEVHDRSLPSFSRAGLKQVLPQLQALMSKYSEDHFGQVAAVCAEVGIGFVATPELPQATCMGATRWVHQNPMIQVSASLAGKDKFWKVLFHELGHVALHGKSEVFLEEVNYDGKDPDKEREADQFAQKWMNG